MKFSENYGFAGGYNHAIRNVQGKYKYTVLLNSDVETPKGWLEPLIDFLETHENVGAVQPKLLSYNQKDTFEYAGASGGFLDCNGYPYCRGRIFATCEKDNGQYDNPISIFWATGAALTVRTDLYLSAGGLDEDFFAHMEEIDLCWRILLTGADIMVVPQSHVYHLGGGSLPASNPRKTYLNFRNNLLLLHKNLPDATRAKKLFRRRLLDTIAWAKFVATFDFANASAVWRAHRHFASMRKKYTTHPSVDLLDTRTDTHRNILIDYYLRSRRTF
jgi:GT2 family glycosyltransferase